MASSFTRFLDHTRRRTTVERTPLDEWSTRRRDLYLHNTQHSRQTSMLPVGIEPTISAGERPQTYALDRAATGTGNYWVCVKIIKQLLTILNITIQIGLTVLWNNFAIFWQITCITWPAVCELQCIKLATWCRNMQPVKDVFLYEHQHFPHCNCKLQYNFTNCGRLKLLRQHKPKCHV